MSAGTDIATEIAAALAEATTATGSGEFTATLIQSGGFSGPESDRTPLPDVETDVTILSDDFGWGQANGTTIQSRDRKLLVSAVGAVPAPKDRMRVQSKVYGVIDVKPLAPGGEALLYEVQLRA